MLFTAWRSPSTLECRSKRITLNETDQLTAKWWTLTGQNWRTNRPSKFTVKGVKRSERAGDRRETKERLLLNHRNRSFYKSERWFWKSEIYLSMKSCHGHSWTRETFKSFQESFKSVRRCSRTEWATCSGPYTLAPHTQAEMTFFKRMRMFNIF